MRTPLVLVLVLSLCTDCSSQECRQDLLENVDFPGTDIRRVYSPDANHCQQMCTQHASCQFFSFLRAGWTGDSRKFFCYLKRTDSGRPNVQKSVVGITSGYSLKPCSTQSTPCFNQIYSNVDFPGADYKSFFTASYKECQRACTRDPGCQFFTWVNDLFSNVKIRFKCHLKFSWTVPLTPIVQKVTGITSGFSVNAQISTDRDAVEECQHQYFQSTNIPGDDILIIPAGTPEHCQVLCSAHPSCTHFSFARTTCYLKHNQNHMRTVHEVGVTSGLPSRFCRQNEDWLFVAHDGLDFPHFDIISMVMDDAGACQRECDSDSNCQFYAYVTSRATAHGPNLRRRCFLKRVITIPAPPKVTVLDNVVSGFALRGCGCHPTFTF